MNHKLDTDTSVFFYEQEFYVLSNFSAFTLNWRGYRFDTSEAAYHWEKFGSINKYEIGDLIRFAPSAHEAFKIAQQFKAEQNPNWDLLKIGIMYDILVEKVRQHEYVRKKLLETGNRELIEDSWRDDFWGWGINKDGQNTLGRLWMKIREEIRTGPFI